MSKIIFFPRIFKTLYFLSSRVSELECCVSLSFGFPPRLVHPKHVFPLPEFSFSGSIWEALPPPQKARGRAASGRARQRRCRFVAMWPRMLHLPPGVQEQQWTPKFELCVMFVRHNILSVVFSRS